MVASRALTLAALMTTLAGPAAAAGPPFELAVKLDHAFGASRGTLVIDRDGVKYRTADRKDAREWSYLDLKQVQVRSTRKIVIASYEDRGRLRLGADRTFEFELTAGAIDPELVAFLLERIERPVVTAVMPPLPLAPQFKLPVKHQRHRRGSEGNLLIYATGVAYLTELDQDARYWRFRDLYSVLPLDRYRLELRAFEGGEGTRPFIFELKTDLPADVYETLWQRVNRPALARDMEAATGRRTAADRRATNTCALAYIAGR